MMFFDRLLNRYNNSRRVGQRKPARQVRRLRLERLLSRELLAADFASIVGTVYTDLQDNGLDGGDPAVASVTVTLYRDGGDGIFDAGLGGGDDVLDQQDTTLADGTFEFDRLDAGTYFVQQLAAAGRLQRVADQVATVVITEAQARGENGTGQLQVDNFDGALQQVIDPAVGLITATSSVAAAEAVGGERDLRVTRTSATGSVEIEVNGVEPNVLAFSSSLTGVGTAQVQWDGVDGDATTVDHLGLRNGGASGADLTAGNASALLIDVGTDQPGNSMMLTVYTDATNFSTYTLNIPDLSGTGRVTEAFTIAFDDFTDAGGSGADFANVGAITVDVTSVESSQLILDVVGAIAPNAVTRNFASFLPLTLGNQVFVDTNDNGTLDAGESGIDDVDIILWQDTNTNGVFDPTLDTQLATDTTAGGGIYSFSNLFPGTYFVQIPAAEFTLGATLSGFQTSLINTPAEDPDTNPANNDDNGNAVTGQGIVTPAITLISLNEPTNDGDADNNTNLGVDLGVVPQVDVQIVKTVFSNQPTVGQAATYRLTVTNNGPRTATNVVVTDTLPVGIDPAAGGLASITRNGTDIIGSVVVAGQLLTMPAIASLATASSVVFDITVNIPADGVGAFNNVAEVTSDGFDTLLDNNDSNVDLNPERRVNLVADKTVSAATVVVGDDFTYTIEVSNQGPSTATGVTLTDVLPANIQFVSGTITRGGNTTSTGVSHAAGTVTVAIGDLDVSEAVTISLVVEAGAGAIGDLTNTASVTATETEAIPADNSASALVTVDAIIDLVIDKQSPATATPGETLTYTLIVTNNGPAAATGVEIVDTLPAGITFVDGQGGTFDSSTAGQVTIDVGNLAVSQSRTLTMVVNVPASAAGQLQNSAVVSSDQTELPATQADNTDTVLTNLVPEVDLVVTKTDQQDPVIPGEQLTYVIVVDNNGPSDATNVILEDVLPAGTTLVSITENGTALTNSATIVGQTVTLPLGSMTAAATARQFLMTVGVAPTVTATLTNNVSVRSDQQANETNAQNNSDTEQTAVNPRAVLTITKDDNVTSAIPGNQLTYTIRVTNSGPSSATNVVVTDTIPSGVTVVNSSAPGGNGTVNGSVLTLPFGTIAPGTTAQATLTVSIGTTTRGTLNNAVSVAGTGAAAGTLSANHTTPLIPTFDVAVTKSVPNTNVSPGDEVTFSIRVENLATSPSAASSVTVTDTLPAGLTFVRGTNTNGAALGSLSNINVGTLEPGAFGTITVVARVSDTATAGTNFNSPVTVSAEAEPATVLQNNNDAVTLNVVQATGSIAGRVRIDGDFDRVLESTESTGIGGFVIELRDHANGNLLATTTSEADGSYRFVDLVPGNYRVTRLLQANFIDASGITGQGASSGQTLGVESFVINLGTTTPTSTAVNYDFGVTCQIFTGLFIR